MSSSGRTTEHGGTIGSRVRDAIRAAQVTQKVTAASVDMTPDALSRSVNDKRAFTSSELVRIADFLGADLRHLVTGDRSDRREWRGQPNPQNTKLPRFEDDEVFLDQLRHAYTQSGTIHPTPPLPRTPHELRVGLGPQFLEALDNRLGQIGVDVIRARELMRPHHLDVEGRIIIAIPTSADWTQSNVDIAMHLAMAAVGRDNPTDQDVISVADELLMPENELRSIDWNSISRAALCRILRRWGVPTRALGARLEQLRIRTPKRVRRNLAMSTSDLFRLQSEADRTEADRGKRSARAEKKGLPLTDLLIASSARTFPRWLINAHLQQVLQGMLPPTTLAWMLDVDVDTIELPVAS
ncbi:helix-turn-helix domain-containing protein [Helcobacillus massiliensis]|uniref:helix-turn-helix domain-containing protein n=1 Tax=Helcobacillus TaxID=1161125 RepID=UPI001EF4540A|nr:MULTISPECIES: helix-turn-helix domain-containing protein [Helcobacillus]MCG7427086.1 helix-turn-helix domain-containing protein [Helcobacillus sp. ACRRO]MCT1557790.1 helix-turn-helix domain-containing protein [Helcobacillus massiliensis]MCT2036972.1 helix-turn-helix domain-containing protein [Helcobacillus massiliensis]MCT2332185.1 helix-turn-helix domain-containing protein [Helcobacillus massiliensis]